MHKNSGKKVFKTTVCIVVGAYVGGCICAFIDGLIKGAITGMASNGNELCQQVCDKCGVEYEPEETEE